MRILLLVVLTLASAGCAMYSPRAYVARGVSAADADQLAGSISSYLADTLPAAETMISLDVPRGAFVRDPLAKVLADDLRQAGFGVLIASGEGAAPSSAHPLSYSIGAWPDGVSVRLQLDSLVISRWYVRMSSGALAPASAFSVREASHGRR
jgi:hypothetical protein